MKIDIMLFFHVHTHFYNPSRCVNYNQVFKKQVIDQFSTFIIKICVNLSWIDQTRKCILTRCQVNGSFEKQIHVILIRKFCAPCNVR